MPPAVYIQFPNSPKASELYCESKEIEVERVELEQRFRDVIPDVVIYAGGKQLFLEVYVTHAIDDVKLEKLKKSDISTIEIDLSKIDHSISLEELQRILLNDSKEKKWVYNSVANKYLQFFYAAADQRDIIPRGFTLHADNCPIKARSWRGKPYAMQMLHHTKTLGVIQVDESVWKKLTREEKQKIERICDEKLEQYYGRFQVAQT